ncbi:unnamed protein product [Amoebophrya sp. A25]|nr:unnamed protein product [Amoebophrya sp. A25]|eukprot:GSA25T00022249001.1
MPELQSSSSSSEQTPAQMKLAATKELWEAGDKEVIENFQELLFPNGSITDLPRNISARCAEVWNGHHVAYRCLTCGISPSSCICVACFNAGEHEGHDYFIYRSDYGGCCDCGDCDAWDVTGFCRYHRMAYEANRRNPCTNLPHKIKNTLRNILPIQLQRLCYHLSEWNRGNGGGELQPGDELMLSPLGINLGSGSSQEQDDAGVNSNNGGNGNTTSSGFVNLRSNRSRSRSRSPGSPGNDDEDSLPEECKDHILFLLKLAQAHDGLRHIISEAFAKEVYGGKSILEFTLRIGSAHLSKETELTNLFLDLMFDANFKRTFARIFLKLYPDLILNRSEVLASLVDSEEDSTSSQVGADPTSLDRVTVQLFSIRAITLELLEDTEAQLLDTLLSTTKALLLLACDRASRVKYLVNNHSILTKRSYFQCTHDLRFVLDHQEVVDELFARKTFREVLWSGWLEIWKIIQCANPHVRIQEDGEHVQHENAKWGNSLVFESDIHSASSSMIVTLENRVRAVDTVKWALIPLCKALRDWIATVRQNEQHWYIALCKPDPVTNEKIAKFTPEDEPCGQVGCDYMVSKQPVSFHIPMHRIFASLMHCVCSSPNETAVIKEKASDADWRSTNTTGSIGAFASSTAVAGPAGIKVDEHDSGLVCMEADPTSPPSKKDMENNVNNNLTIDTDINLSSPPPKRTSKDPASGSPTKQGLFASIVSQDSPKKTPAEKKKSGGMSSFLARLENNPSLAGKGGVAFSNPVVEHDAFKDVYALFSNTEELFRKVMGEENFTTVDLLHLMEHPLRCLVFHAQCYGFSSLWLRNGDSVAYEACFYKKNYWHSLFVDPDLTLIRLVMLALSETDQLPAFIATFLQRFEAGPRLVGHSVETLFLTLCQCLAVEPYTFKANDVERITEYHCIHVLAKGPCTHSELTDTIMKSHDNADFLDGILRDIADFQEPDASVQGGHRTSGKYILKTPLWKHVDTLFLLYSWKEQHEIEEKKLEKLGPKLANTFVPTRHFGEIEPFVVPCYRRGLRKIASEPTLVSVPLVSLLQTYLLPLEMVNHRGLHLSLLLLQRLLMLVDRKAVMECGRKHERRINVSAQAAGNVFALAKALVQPGDEVSGGSRGGDASRHTGDTAGDADLFADHEEHDFYSPFMSSTWDRNRITMVEAANTIIELDCCEVSPNCLARYAMEGGLGGGGTGSSSRNNASCTSSTSGGGFGSPSRPSSAAGAARSPLTLDTEPLHALGSASQGDIMDPSTSNNNPSSSSCTSSSSSSMVRFSLLQCFEAILKEPSCKQHVHVINQNLVLLQSYNLYAPSERRRRQNLPGAAPEDGLNIIRDLMAIRKNSREQTAGGGTSSTSSSTAGVSLFGSTSLSTSTSTTGTTTGTTTHASTTTSSATHQTASSSTASSSQLFATSSIGAASSVGGRSSTAAERTPSLMSEHDASISRLYSMADGTLDDDAAMEDAGMTAEKTEAEKKKEARRKKQAAMLKKFNKKQKNFLTTSEEAANMSPNKGDLAKTSSVGSNAASTLTPAIASTAADLTAASRTGSTGVVALQAPSTPYNANKSMQLGAATSPALICEDVDACEEAECVICFCVHPGEKTGGNPLGRMAHLQRTCVSNVPRLKRQAAGSSNGSPLKPRKRKRGLSPQKSFPGAVIGNSGAASSSGSTTGGLGLALGASSKEKLVLGGGDAPTSLARLQSAPPLFGGAASSSTAAEFDRDGDSVMSPAVRTPKKHEQQRSNTGEPLLVGHEVSNSTTTGVFGQEQGHLQASSSSNMIPPPTPPIMGFSAGDISPACSSPLNEESSSESSACEAGLEDPNQRRMNEKNAAPLIEELEPEPPSVGLYVWSCSHKIHYECWRRLRHGATAANLHCPYCNHPVHVFIPANPPAASTLGVQQRPNLLEAGTAASTLGITTGGAAGSPSSVSIRNSRRGLVPATGGVVSRITSIESAGAVAGEAISAASLLSSSSSTATLEGALEIQEQGEFENVPHPFPELENSLALAVMRKLSSTDRSGKRKPRKSQGDASPLLQQSGGSDADEVKFAEQKQEKSSASSSLDGTSTKTNTMGLGVEATSSLVVNTSKYNEQEQEDATMLQVENSTDISPALCLNSTGASSCSSSSSRSSSLHQKLVLRSFSQMEEWDSFFKMPIGQQQLLLAMQACKSVSWALKSRTPAATPFCSFLDWIQNVRLLIRGQYCLIPPGRSEQSGISGAGGFGRGGQLMLGRGGTRRGAGTNTGTGLGGIGGIGLGITEVLQAARQFENRTRALLQDRQVVHTTVGQLLNRAAGSTRTGLDHGGTTTTAATGTNTGATGVDEGTQTMPPASTTATTANASAFADFIGRVNNDTVGGTPVQTRMAISTGTVNQALEQQQISGVVSMDDADDLQFEDARDGSSPLLVGAASPSPRTGTTGGSTGLGLGQGAQVGEQQMQIVAPPWPAEDHVASFSSSSYAWTNTATGDATTGEQQPKRARTEAGSEVPTDLGSSSSSSASGVVAAPEQGSSSGAEVAGPGSSSAAPWGFSAFPLARGSNPPSSDPNSRRPSSQSSVVPLVFNQVQQGGATGSSDAAATGGASPQSGFLLQGLGQLFQQSAETSRQIIAGTLMNRSSTTGSNVGSPTLLNNNGAPRASSAGSVVSSSNNMLVQQHLGTSSSGDGGALMPSNTRTGRPAALAPSGGMLDDQSSGNIVRLTPSSFAENCNQQPSQAGSFDTAMEDVASSSGASDAAGEQQLQGGPLLGGGPAGESAFSMVNITSTSSAGGSEVHTHTANHAPPEGRPASTSPQMSNQVLMTPRSRSDSVEEAPSSPSPLRAGGENLHPEQDASQQLAALLAAPPASSGAPAPTTGGINVGGTTGSGATPSFSISSAGGPGAAATATSSTTTATTNPGEQQTSEVELRILRQFLAESLGMSGIDLDRCSPELRARLDSAARTLSSVISTTHEMQAQFSQIDSLTTSINERLNALENSDEGATNSPTGTAAIAHPFQTVGGGNGAPGGPLMAPRNHHRPDAAAGQQLPSIPFIGNNRSVGAAGSATVEQGTTTTSTGAVASSKLLTSSSIAGATTAGARKGETEAMRTVMRSLAPHPVAILGSVLADQIRLDEIRLRAKGTFVLEPKRLDLLRSFVDSIQAYNAFAPPGFAQASPPGRGLTTSAGAASFQSASSLIGPPPPFSPPRSDATTTSGGDDQQQNALAQEQNNNLQQKEQQHQLNNMLDLEKGEGASKRSSLYFSATELLVRKIVCTAIPCDPAVLHEWSTFGSVLSVDLARQTGLISLMHTLKLLFATLESEFSFLEIPYFAPGFQTEPTVFDLYRDNQGAGEKLSRELLSRTNNVNLQMTLTGLEDDKMDGSGRRPSSSSKAVSSTMAPPPAQLDSCSSAGIVVPQTTEESGSSGSSASGGDEADTPSGGRPPNAPRGERVTAGAGNSLYNAFPFSSKTRTDLLTRHDSLISDVGTAETSSPDKKSVLSDCISTLLNGLEELQNGNGDDALEEDLFHIFDQEDREQREELRREKNELRRAAEYFVLSETEARNLVGVAILPLLRRQCLLQHVLSNSCYDITTAGASTGSAGEQAQPPQTTIILGQPGVVSGATSSSTPPPTPSTPSWSSGELPPVDKEIAAGRITNAWEHACYLAKWAGHDLEAVLNFTSPAGGASSSAQHSGAGLQVPRYIWKKMNNAVEKWRNSRKAASRAVVELVPSLNQKAVDELTGRQIPYIRPKFAKNSSFIRLSCKQDCVNQYAAEYSKQVSSGSKPSSLLLSNRCFYLEFHLLGFGKTPTGHEIVLAGSDEAASASAAPGSGNENKNTSSTVAGGAAAGSSTSCMSTTAQLKTTTSSAGTAAASSSSSGTNNSSTNNAMLPTLLHFNHNGGVLIKLPYLYQTLYTTYIHKQCPLCFPPPPGSAGAPVIGGAGPGASSSSASSSSTSNQPKVSFLCLFSGRHLCAGGGGMFQEMYGLGHHASAGNPNCPNSFTKHAPKCAAGLSVLMNLLSGLVHIQKDDKICVWGAIYLDAYGEEDRYLTRGKPLYLSQARLGQLTAAIAAHSFDSDTKLVWKQL